MKFPRAAARLLVIPALLCVLATSAFSALPKTGRAGPVTWSNPLLEKTFPLLAVLESDPAVGAALAAHPELAALAQAKFRAIPASAAASKDATTLDALTAQIDPLLWSDAEIQQVAEILRGLLADSPALRAAVRDNLRPSGLFALHEKLPDADFLARAWGDAAGMVNLVIKTYALGVPPRYAKIDALAYDPASAYHVKTTRELLVLVRDDPEAARLFIQPSLRFAVMLLQAHQRDYAGRFEPLHAGENQAAFARAAKIDWTRYKHTALLVLGHGAHISGVPLSPTGRASLDAAIRRFREGDSAFLVLTGGYVWPSGTNYCEAVEMKRVVVRDFGVPEECVIIDPHARHTTTNYRNTARLFIRLGAPLDKTIRVLTTDTHVNYIVSPRFQRNAKKELGYSPFTLVSQAGPLELIGRLSPLSTQVGADPLDP
ncbi:hypothetical protein M2447_001652 [Ereboglobus sp. PH5-10]|uniref:YdcF family protein n=1 Tax=Ereboglobus sp. PH5-10 TaxID=2940629 RepID=UPI0024054251|nr:YdcF family protein [Ereboglobus sp. PH5-10]MDF9827554.1 hypothetical protein [Ereboglobus sp. PH5-10]